jgi:CRISPR system Cascade subunit CasA
MSDFVSLLDTPWLPAARASGVRVNISPSDITQDPNDPIVDLCWSRPDFRCAALEWLIGLLTVALPPENNDAWRERWDRPPSPAELRASLASFAPAFRLDGASPRAYQDFEELSGESTPVEALLIEAPGANTVKNNAALLVKAGRAKVLSRPAAAMALITLQTMAPSGGAGHRTSLRGGGPLTTLVVPKSPRSLWHLLWANVPRDARGPVGVSEQPRVFPWLAATRHSGAGGRTTTPEDVDSRQVFFGMPRRIRLDFEPNEQRLPCDLTGEIDDVVVRSYRTRPGGTNYDAWGGRHPLTPHYRSRASDPVLYPVHGQDGRIGYRQWAGMIFGDKEGLRQPAECVSVFLADRKDDLPRHERAFRLSAAGYAMDNMKALAFMEAETPDILAPPGKVDGVARAAQNLVVAANEAANLLVQAVKRATWGDRATVAFDSTPLTSARDRFWSATTDEFFTVLNRLSAAGDKAATSAWRLTLERAALAVFDEAVPIEDAQAGHLDRLIEGRRLLVLGLRGYGAAGKRLFEALALPLPEKKAKKAKVA